MIKRNQTNVGEKNREQFETLSINFIHFIITQLPWNLRRCKSSKRNTRDPKLQGNIDKSFQNVDIEIFAIEDVWAIDYWNAPHLNKNFNNLSP